MNNITCHDLTAINFDYNQQKGVIERLISRIYHADCDTMDDASPVTKVKESSHGTPSQNEPTDSPISGFFEKF